MIGEISRDEVRSSIEDKLCAHFSVTSASATDDQVFQATAIVINEIMSRLLAAESPTKHEKEVHYMSMEFLMGRSLMKNAFNLGISEAVTGALEDLGRNASDIFEAEPDAGLGNGGLGRLAACYMDSMATCGYEGTGYSICYELGIFRQKFENGRQTEVADNWRTAAESWLIPRWEDAVEVRFGGHVAPHWDNMGHYHAEYTGYTAVIAVPRDMLIAGYGGHEINTLRLWDAKSPNSLDMYLFSEGEYVKSMEQRTMAEVITKVLYPPDEHVEGKILRLKQQYFFVSATAQDVVRKHIRKWGDIKSFAEHHAMQINDTHPTLIIPELMRIFMDEYGLGWDEAWDIVTHSVAYTNHTVMSEALEKWPLASLQKVSPAIADIIVKLDEVAKAEHDDPRVAIIDEHDTVHMAHMDIHFGFSINGVAALHTKILEDTELHPFYEIYPEKFSNKTNGITFRRWIHGANPALASLLDDVIGTDWRSTGDLSKLAEFANDKDVLERLAATKAEAKAIMRQFMALEQGVTIPSNAIIDVQVKRIHEYKRQQMLALYIIWKYLDIKNGNKPKHPVTIIFGGKAAPAYTIAQDIIHLILTLSQWIANDPDVAPYLQVVMIENYNVTAAERVIPAADISEQISLASKEASGTSNMKFMLNGALTLCTLDGANVEIAELVGDENIYTFGASSKQVEQLYADGSYNAGALYRKPGIKLLVDFITNPAFMATGNAERLQRLHDDIKGKDWFMALLDIEEYIQTKERVLADYEDQDAWMRKALINIANAGTFSSDRTISQYNEEIWHLS